MNNLIKLNYRDFEKAFKVNLSESVRKRIIKYDIEIETLKAEERDEVVRQILEVILDPEVVRAGKHRASQWEFGWNENFVNYSRQKKVSNIIPKYFGKYPIIRWKQDFYKVNDKTTEYKMLGVLLDWLFDVYMKEAEEIYEFGCGTGHNLIRLRRHNPKARLWGLDWTTSSQRLISELNKNNIVSNLKGKKFDYYHPDNDFKLSSKGVVFTVASLEQIGVRYKPFVKYLLDEKPSLCVHIEPIGELLDSNNLIDFLSLKYFNKRNYLNGYLGYLESLEKLDRLKIHLCQRSFVGSMFVDGYSVIVWSPK